MGLAAQRAAWLAQVAPGLAVVLPRQVHGTLIADAGDPAALERADGVVTRDPALALAVLGSDCPGLVLDTGAALGLAHCGWRGCAGGIVPALVERLRSLGGPPPSHWRAFIGPGISQRRYEVDAPVLGAREWPPEAMRRHRPGHALLDLRAVIGVDLRAAGVENLRVSPRCTATDPWLHSYRLHGPGGNQLLLAWRSPLA